MAICRPNPQLPDCRLIGSWLALHHNQKRQTENGKHSEWPFLPIRYFRLPDQKPFAPDIEECHQPHQQARRQRNHDDVQRSGELGAGQPFGLDFLSSNNGRPTLFRFWKGWENNSQPLKGFDFICPVLSFLRLSISSWKLYSPS